MGEQEAEKTSGEPGSLSVEPAVPHSLDTGGEPVAAAGQETAQAAADIESPALAPEQNTAAEMPEDAADAPYAAEAEATPIPGEVIVMSSDDRAWGDGAGPETDPREQFEMFGKRRFAAIAAMVALATVAGTLGGALATATLIRGADTASNSHALETSVARIDADILALKAGLENSAKLGLSQFNKTSDRLDKIERAQAEPAARLAKLSDAVDKLRAASSPLPPVAAAPTAASKEVTGSVSPASPSASPKIDVGRLPTVEGWVLREVVHGGALIDGKRGIYEVYAGDVVPGLGRIDAVRRQDGRWVVVTGKGLIVGR